MVEDIQKDVFIRIQTDLLLVGDSIMTDRHLSEVFTFELVTPFVLESEYANAHDQDAPWWWKEGRREREEKMLEQREVYKLQTVDRGQVVACEGDRPVETAKNGILRAG